ncbi:hypothetical protein EMIHUDRAFT_254895 [Emiliania huxleyi CCMP1516]|uniref:Uncharacterized protein n=2 Tax=Emiliania huxleyi TaxID=2903 RepID=A0A0D3JJM3_EMIH1|nr:hypothetical protein EMIHUDRAFT_254895 [Emiliania huxleyi CCMP1516]EOD23708.1 hypothetical protein EMIHUDRAFT_254895 [Emiliania huxleyi CCMP1516]|eukprot:XP_005776137.1 hypothetical protein EMIHUDRAFT_254895 [Emiliania huxleyi CCMP1516]
MRAASLTTLELVNKGIGVVGGFVVAGLMPVMASLKSLYLSDNALCGATKFGEGTYDATGIKAIADALRDSASTLTSLNLADNYLADEGAKALAPAIAASTSLTTLVIHSNQIGDEGAKALAPAIAASASLTAANLLRNDFDVDAASMLLKAKQEHPTLTTLCGFKGDETRLNFSRQSLRPADAMLIAPEISVMASLTAANLLCNNLDKESATMLATVAKEKKISLCGIGLEQTSADFRGQGLEPNDSILIASDLGVRASLTKLNVRYNYNLGEEGKAAIKEADEAAIKGVRGGLTPKEAGETTTRAMRVPGVLGTRE